MGHKAFVNGLPTLIVLCFGTYSHAQENVEVAVLKGHTNPINWLAFSADGSRLVSASCGIEGAGKSVVGFGQAIVWDVAKQEKISVCRSLPVAKVNTAFSRVWMSKEGKTVITASGLHYQAWDAETGKLSSTVQLAPLAGNFTTAAISPDGNFLAVAWDERIGKPLNPFRVGEIQVWNTKSGRIQWRVPGTLYNPKGAGLRDGVLMLAFSPDSTRLAALSSRRLKIMSLASDTATAAAMPLEGEVNESLSPHALYWLSDDKTLLVSRERSFERWDTIAGKRVDAFELKIPRVPAPKPPAGRFPLPGDSAGIPIYLGQERQGALTSDGQTQALYVCRTPSDLKPGVKENDVVLWDIAARRVKGILPLPKEEFVPAATIRKSGPLGLPQMFFNNVHELRIALSPNGKFLAVGETSGVVRVYDVAKIGVNTKIGKADTPKPAGDDPLPVGSIWKGERMRPQGNLKMSATLKITEREVSAFNGEFTTAFDNQTSICEVAGCVIEGKIEFNTTRVIKGSSHQPVAATLKGNRIEGTWAGPNPQGRVVNGTITLTRSDDK